MDNGNIPFGYNDDGTPNLGSGSVVRKKDWDKIYEEKIEQERKEWEKNFYTPTPEEMHLKLIKERRERNEQ